MAKKREDPPAIVFAWLPKLKKRTPPTQEMTTFFKGFDDVQARYETVEPEAEVEAARGELEKQWTTLTTPKSPLTPYEAGLAAETFATQTNLAALGMTVGLIAAEATSLGQLDVNLAKLLDIPLVSATFSAAARVRTARLDTAFIKAASHLWLWQYRPTLVPEGVAIDLYAKGLIGKESFKWYLAHYGYTDERSDLIGYSAYRFPGTGEILDLRARGYITADRAVDWLKFNRLPESVARALLPLAERRPGFSEASEMLWRGLMTEEAFQAVMRRQGYPDYDAKSLAELTKQIPPAADLVTMVVREAFDPAMVTPAPDVFAKFMAMKGFGKEWSDRYWTMHWTPIALRQAYENLWRGHWTKDQFMRALHIADVHPMWREDIYNVAFRPPGMREMGYGYDVGVYTEKDIATYRRWDGLSPEDADKAARSMVAYRTEAEREAVRREHLHLFSLGRETLPQFEANLKRLGTAPAAVPLWLERAELEKVRREREPTLLEPRGVTAGEALTAFEMGIRTEAWTRAKLADLYWTPERIDLRIEEVKWQDRASDEIRKRRTVLEDMLKEGFLKKVDFTTALKAMNFTPPVIAALEEWAQVSQVWDDVKEQAAEWWRLAKAGKITPEAYAAEARKLGMTEARITSKMGLLRKLAEIRQAEEAAKAK